MIDPDNEGEPIKPWRLSSPRARDLLVIDRGWVANIVLLIVICHTFDRLAYRASPDNITTHHGRRGNIPTPALPLSNHHPLGAILPWYPTHPKTNTDVPTGPGTESEYCEHRLAVYRAAGLTTTN